MRNIFTRAKQGKGTDHRRRVKRFKKLKNHPFVIPIVTFLVLFFASIVGLVALQSHTIVPDDAHIVIVSHDKTQEIVPTSAATVSELLQRLDLKLNDGDVVEPDIDTAIVEDNFRVNIYRARPILVVDQGRKIFAYSAATTPRSVAAQVGVDVYPEDDLQIEPVENFIKDNAIGSEMVITRATPANINLYGTPVTVRTHAKTVNDLLKEKNVKLSADDSVEPAVDTPLTPNVLVFVTRKGTQLVTEEQTIAPTTKTIEDASLSFGAKAVRQKGAAGKRLVTYEIQLTNGKETARKLIQEVIVQAPVEEIIARGKAVNIPADKTTIMAGAGIAASDYPYASYIINHENALWCPTRWQGQNNCPAYYEEKYPGAETNAKTGYGLCQSTPAAKMASAGADWRVNAVTQMKWCSGYAKGRYGSWEAAYNHWISHGNW